MPTLFQGVLWSASFTRLRFFGSCPWLYRGLLPGASLRMPTLFWGVQWSACLSGLCRATFGSSAPTLLRYGGLLLGASFAHARFLSQGIWWGAYLPGLHRATFFCHFLFWASSWVIIRLIPFSSMLQFVGAFFWMRFLQASLSSGPGFWLSPEGSVFLPSLLAFLRIRFILCRFLLGAYFAEHF